jgi:hypothetical protein
MGYKLTLELPDEVYQSLVRRAKETGQSPEVVTAELLASVARQVAEAPLEQFVGAFDSRGSDWADRHDKYLGDANMESACGPLRSLSKLRGFLRGIDTEIEREPDPL